MLVLLATLGYLLIAARFYLWAATKASYLQETQEEGGEVIYLFHEDAQLKRAA